VQHIALDATLAREELGWQATVGLDEGLERTLASLR
jgi:nucleoside-diphosphate-sugar epimerase